MKKKELENKFKNKYVIRVIAGVVCVALVGSGYGAYQVYAEKTTEEEAVIETQEGDSEETEQVTAAINNLLSQSGTTVSDVDKEETVYVIADNTGDADEEIVSVWLKNSELTDELADVSELENIENVKGDETFEQFGDQLVWAANGNDIYYRGTTSKETPVTEEIVYYLDGKEISPEELAGQSGKVTIRFNYTNNATVTEEVDGETYEVKVPFTVVTGLILDDSFSNVEVTNGKLVSDGDKNVVIGLATPGLAESLNVEEADFSEDVSLPEYVEVTADVENFELDMTMSVVMSGLLNNVDLTGDLDLSSVEESLEELTDATGQLVDGSGELADGLDTLNDSMTTFVDGTNTLKDGISAYTTGASTLKSGIDTLYSGTTTLQGNMESNAMVSGAQSLADGAAQVSAGVTQLTTTMANMGDTVKGKFVAASGLDEATFDTLMSATGNLVAAGMSPSEIIAALDASTGGNGAAIYNLYYQYQGALSVVNVLSENASSLATLQSGAAQVATGAASLSSGVSQVYDAVVQINSGVAQLQTGAGTLISNNDTLNNGAQSLADGAVQIQDGVSQLDEGANTLADGLLTFNNEGIQKLADAYNGDVKDLLEHVEAVMDAAEDYTTFTGAAEDQTSTVKFIIKTDGVEVTE